MKTWHQKSKRQGRLVDQGMFHRTVAVIDVTALRHNFSVVRRYCPQQKIMAMIKANAYGHGAVACAEALTEADGFGVACLGEAIELRQAGIKQPIFVMSGFNHIDELNEFVDYDLVSILHHTWQVEALLASQLSKPLKVWLKIDTGMGRMGLSPKDFMASYTGLSDCDHVVHPLGLMTHLACADDVGDPMSAEQIRCFWRLVEKLPGEKSIANSGGILHWSQACEQSQWVRPGIMLYGAPPALEDTSEAFDLKPVMTLKTHVLSVKAMKSGCPVGYGQAWQCDRDTSIAVLGIGYGDGLPRISQGYAVAYGEVYMPIVGRVSMDLTTIDCGRQVLQPGDQVVVWGQGGQSVMLAAQQLDNFHYQLLTGVSERVRRVYIE